MFQLCEEFVGCISVIFKNTWFTKVAFCNNLIDGFSLVASHWWLWVRVQLLDSSSRACITPAKLALKPPILRSKSSFCITSKEIFEDAIDWEDV